MPITLNGTGTISGINVGGLPDGIVDADMLASGVGGKVLQYKVANKTDQSSYAGTTPAAIPSFSVTITPTASNSTMIVRASCFYSMNGDVICSRIYNGTNFLISPNSFPSPEHQSGSSSAYTAGQYMFQQEFMAYETSGNTNSRTYNIYWSTTGSGTGYINRWHGYDGYHSVSTLEVIEVAA